MSRAELTKRGALWLAMVAVAATLVFGECISVRNRLVARQGDARREVLAQEIISRLERIEARLERLEPRPER